MKNKINPAALYWASFSRFELRLPGACVIDCSGQGAVDEVVAFWTPRVVKQAESDAFPNSPTPEKIRAELKECGDWDAAELADNEKNWRRLVWIAACNIAEDENPYCGEPLKN